MYDFKHKIDNQQRFNSYEISMQHNSTSSTPYQILRNTLLFIILLLTTFIIGAFVAKSYQSHKRSLPFKPLVIQEIETKEGKALNVKTTQVAHATLTQTVTDRVMENLKANNQNQTIDYSELKLIIQQVVNKVKNKPKDKKINTIQRRDDVL